MENSMHISFDGDDFDPNFEDAGCECDTGGEHVICVGPRRRQERDEEWDLRTSSYTY